MQKSKSSKNHGQARHVKQTLIKTLETERPRSWPFVQTTLKTLSLLNGVANVFSLHGGRRARRRVTAFYPR
jgi:hypothetical protein